MFVGKLGTFVALGVRGSGMIENRSFNLGEFCVKMGKKIIIMAVLLRSMRENKRRWQHHEQGIRARNRNVESGI